MSQETPSWTDEVRRSFRDPRELAAHLELSLADLPPLPDEPPRFPFLVPRPFAARMRRGDPLDPLLRQVWPDPSENDSAPGERDDPVGDLRSSREAGLLQKYEGRALVVATGACALSCRYCFRQNFDYHQAPRSASSWDGAFARIRDDASLGEIVLSGGDPLSLPDSVIQEWFARVEAMPRVHTLRLHTRFPVAIPSRITAELLARIAASRLRVVVVLHANHPSEIAPELRHAAAGLRRAGATLLNQSVLLAGVNDSTDVLEALSRALWEAGILPYYLHALDPVRGSSRFRVPDARGSRLVDEIRRRLPGYLVPRFVREIEGEASKTPVP